MDIINYKCPCCDATLEFNGQEQKLVCKFCDNTFDVDTVKAYNEELIGSEDNKDYGWQEYDSDSGNGDWQDGETDAMKVYTCPSCGAEIMSDETTAATFCLYCGNSTILPGKLSGTLKPDYVVPFRYTKEQAKEALKGFYKGKRLLPTMFSEENRIDKITGVYVPFWLFDGDADAVINYKATKMKTWSDSNYRYTKTDHYMVVRAGDIGFNYIPADGSSKADDKFMESIEPFNFGDAVDFQTAYLSGYLADKYDVTAEQCKDKINTRIKNSTTEAFRNTVVGYSSVIPSSTNIKIKEGKIRYALMPVWMLNTKYKDKIYTFAMNGQTGKIAGELPVSREKYFGWLFSIAGICTAVATLIYFIAF